jgi:hypothetical protein
MNPESVLPGSTISAQFVAQYSGNTTTSGKRAAEAGVGGGLGSSLVGMVKYVLGM